MQVKPMINVTLWLLRIVVVAEVLLDAAGLLWFSAYYFSMAHAFDTMIVVVSMIGLLIGAFVPTKIFRDSRGFYAVTGILLVAAVCVVTQMHGDLTLINGPDYAAFRSRLVDIGLLAIFVARAIYCRIRVTME